MNPSDAEEHLRVIRRLMERATIYRAISAPTALVGGLASSCVGTYLHFRGSDPISAQSGSNEKLLFFIAWGAVLIVTGLANGWFLSREAKKRGGPFLSPGMRKALGALFPAMMAAGIVTLAIASRHDFTVLPLVWMVFYGLALLAASQFSPQAIPRLGWAFLACGLAGILLWSANPSTQILSSPHLLMAISFGGLHLLYAAFTWSTSQRDEATHV